MTDDPLVTQSSLMDAAQDPANKQAWRAMFDKYRPLIERWIQSQGGSPHDAEDVAQDVLQKLVTALGKYDRERNGFRRWLRKVASNCWIDEMRRRKRQLPPGWTEWSESFSAIVVQTDEQEVLEHALARLSPRLREQSWEAFRLLKYERQSAAEISKALDLSVEAVYQAAYRVKKTLAQAYAEERELE